MIYRFLPWILIAAALVCPAGLSGQQAGDSKAKDMKLLDAIRAAADNGTAAEKV
jgi:hypothetical protein